MSQPGPLGAAPIRHLREVLTGAPGVQALAVTIIGWSFMIPFTHSLLGWAGVAAGLATLCFLAALMLIGRREYIEWSGAIPLTIVVFVIWCLLSVLWATSPGVAIVGAAYQLGFGFLGVAVALSRDTIQVVRAVGTAMRILLTASLMLEIFSGILLDTPVPFLKISGTIASGGPIQGVFGTRSFLAFATMIALISFVIEWRTRSVPKPVAGFSISLALMCLLLSRSPVMMFVAVFLGIATAALYGIRKASAQRRPALQWGLLVLSLVLALIVYLNRVWVLTLLNANGEFLTRYSLWIQVWRLIPVNPMEGWGWTGIWRQATTPYNTINFSLQTHHTSALNAYLDVALQVGLVGAGLFLILGITAFIRSWLLASNRRTVTYTWPALIMVALAGTSMAESFVLTSGGWVMFVICAVLASRSTSWLARFRETRRALPPVPRE
ncbi:exopolysaccharide production protein [Mycetocola tolaasinivorans]|uniref:Exopolysaccharide production protein n=1 Tax=Mycetocola tolaasinivorans TaxID=76635 RepID=A0A3L7A8U0_9MICO|nr:O-antigen ligase family protein [Mycetocola tolaasinivorans]RLP76001.1 exopolysaccharide production protein [Mycetocola tolaasinivorans]